MVVEIRSVKSACIGALDGHSDIAIANAGVSLSCNGSESLGFGGLSEDTDIRLDNTEVKGKVQNKFNKVTLTKKERIVTNDGVIRLTGADSI